MSFAAILLMVALMPPAAEELPPPGASPIVSAGGLIGSVGEWLAAMTLLNQPPDDPEDLPPTPPASGEAYQQARLALQTVAIEWQILDAGECGYILTHPEQFANDLSLLRQRRIDMADMPLAQDVGRFPQRQAVWDRCAFSKEFQATMELRSVTNPLYFWECRAIAAETERLHDIWDWLRIAQAEHNTIVTRRYALANLRNMLGNADYYAATMPPWVPLGAFYGDH